MRFAFVILAFALSLTGQAALPRLAYFGALQGEIAVPSLPPLTWKLAATEPFDGRQSAAFTLTGEGLALRAIVDADETTGSVTWRIEEGRVQLGPWFSALAARYAPAVGTATATGEMIITGEGTLEGFKPVGRLALQCHDVTVRDSTQGWAMEGVNLTGDFMLGPDFAVKSGQPLELSIRTISTARFGARAFSSRVRVESFSSVAVETAHVEIAGGEVDAEPFTIPLSPLSLQTRVRVKRIGLQDFAQLVPSGLADARGRLDGELRLGWSEATGFQLGIGKLALDEFEPTVLRLAPSPGLLTSRLPARIEFLPGALGRWLSFRNAAYDDLRDIELGHTDLAVNSLRVVLTPGGDAEGRSARVFIDAGPVKKNAAVKQVIFTINVAGPLSELLNLYMTDNISFEAH